jgi:signal transduction histidine kinase
MRGGSKMKVMGLFTGLPSADATVQGFDIEERFRRILSRLAIMIATPALYVGSFVYFFQGGYVVGLFILAIAASFTLSFIYLRRAKDSRATFRFNLILVGLTFLYFFELSKPFGFKALWLYSYPLACFFLLGRREGLFFSVALLVASLMLVAGHSVVHSTESYESAFVLRFSVSYLFVSAFSLAYETVRNRFRDGMIMRQQELLREKERLLEAKQLAESARNELESSNQTTKSLIRDAPFGVIVVGMDKRVRMANNVALSMMGYASEAEIVGKICHEVLCPAEEGKCPVLDLRQSVERSERVLVTKNRSRFPIQKTVKKVELAEGPVLVEAFTDISQLIETREIAKSASRAKSDFLANMSHELRTPLNHIIGFTELVVDENFGDINDIQEEYLKDVLHSSRHLLSLINDILDLSKVEAGKLDLNPSNVNLKEILMNSLIMVKEKALKHGINVGTEISGVPETIRADERKLKQIMYNLLSNAVKFTPDRGVITVTARPVSVVSGHLVDREGRKVDLGAMQGERPLARGDYVEISVGDSGIGIKQENLERIFQPFVQVESSSNRKYQGTGLGLSLTRSLVELHGGLIWAESKGENQGSSFHLVLPAGPQEGLELQNPEKMTGIN